MRILIAEDDQQSADSRQSRRHGGRWYHISSNIPAADAGAAGNPSVIANGNLVFDSNGNLTTPAGNVTGLSITNLTEQSRAFSTMAARRCSDNWCWRPSPIRKV